MTEQIVAITSGHPLWSEAIAFAAQCSWAGGHFLAEQMRSDAFLPWERVFVALAGARIVGFCTLTEKDELPATFDLSPFIGFVFVEESFRGKRLSERLIDCAADYAKVRGFSRVYLMSGERGLYEKYGFSLRGRYPTIYGGEEQLFCKELL